ncbi:MAG: hypothetical protein M1828_005888 [Chrysothrix sp. TS-e1954]|nr:MAG: hypothetical protein M1828_005888 [Chrysothrix sp. TS-e1954]
MPSKRKSLHHQPTNAPPSASKRPRPNHDSQTHPDRLSQIHSSSSFQRPPHGPHQNHKPTQSHNPPPYQSQSQPTLSTLKKRARDLHRTITRNNAAPSASTSTPNSTSTHNHNHAHPPQLPADILQSAKRELSSLNHKISTLTAAKERKRQIGKYHMVRFFERQRAVRNLRRAARAASGGKDMDAEEGGEGVEGEEGGGQGVEAGEGKGGEEERRRMVEEEEEREKCKTDLEYTQYFPLSQNYVSLFPASTRAPNTTTTTSSSSAKYDTHPEPNHPSSSSSSSDSQANPNAATRKKQPQQQPQPQAQPPNRTHPIWRLIASHQSDEALLRALRDGPPVPDSQPRPQDTEIGKKNIVGVSESTGKGGTVSEKAGRRDRARDGQGRRMGETAGKKGMVGEMGRARGRMEDRKSHDVEDGSSDDEGDGAGFFERRLAP